jgi:DNA polymerase V
MDKVEIIQGDRQQNLEIHPADTSSEASLPYASDGIKAGFPSPAQDYMDASIDLNRELIKHPASTFFGRVSGDSMLDAGLEDGDILIIDKSLDPVDGDIAVCYIDGEFTVKYIRKDEGHDFLWLFPANPDYRPVRITEENDFLIWGIVTASIRKHRAKKRNR